MNAATLEARVASVVAGVLRDNGRPPPDASGGLSLDSLAVVALVDALEQTLAIRLRPEDLTSDGFASLAAVTALCRRRGAQDTPS